MNYTEKICFLRAIIVIAALMLSCFQLHLKAPWLIFSELTLLHSIFQSTKNQLNSLTPIGFVPFVFIILKLYCVCSSRNLVFSKKFWALEVCEIIFCRWFVSPNKARDRTLGNQPVEWKSGDQTASKSITKWTFQLKMSSSSNWWQWLIYAEMIFVCSLILFYWSALACRTPTRRKVLISRRFVVVKVIY